MIQTDTDGYTALAYQHIQPDPAVEKGRLVPVFSMEPVLNEEKSAQEGRPIYEEKEFIKIYVPGDKDNVVFREVWPIDRYKYAAQYERFKAGHSQDTVPGTPITALTWLTRSQAEEFKHFKITTVEQLAEMSDTLAQQFMGFQGIKKKAQDFLAASKDAAHLTAMRREMEQKDSTIAEMNARIAALEKSVASAKK